MPTLDEYRQRLAAIDTEIANLEGGTHDHLPRPPPSRHLPTNRRSRRNLDPVNPKLTTVDDEPTTDEPTKSKTDKTDTKP